jgi:hypothetical protein
MKKTLLILLILSSVAKADPFSDIATGAPMIPMGILHSGLSIAQSKVSLKKPAFTVELTNSKVENIMPILIKPFCWLIS